MRPHFAPWHRWSFVCAASAVAAIAFAGPALADQTISISNFSFQPPTATVPTGTIVTWTNNDAAPHSVTADGGSFDSSPSCSPSTTGPCLAPGATFSHTFATAGTFAYHCRVHSSMHGTIVVTQAATATTMPAAVPPVTTAPSPGTPASPPVTAAPAPTPGTPASPPATVTASTPVGGTAAGAAGTPGSGALATTGPRHLAPIAFLGLVLLAVGGALAALGARRRTARS